jgi:RNA polymerase-interacting CarD/CdnL/TRCF family regulator
LLKRTNIIEEINSKMIKKKYQEEIKSGKLPKTPILYIMIVRTNKNPNKNAQLMRSPT